MPSKLIVAIALVLCAVVSSATAQCKSTNLKSVAELEKNSLVIDVHPRIESINSRESRRSRLKPGLL